MKIRKFYCWAAAVSVIALAIGKQVYAGVNGGSFGFGILMREDLGTLKSVQDDYLKIDGCEGKTANECCNGIEGCESAGSSIRIHFPRFCNLRNSDKLIVRPKNIDDADYRQELDRISFSQWGKSTAYFNGSEVEVFAIGETAKECIRLFGGSPRMELQYLFQSSVFSDSKARPLSVLGNGRRSARSRCNEVGGISCSKTVGRLFMIDRFNPVCTAWVARGANERDFKLVSAGHCLAAIGESGLDRPPVVEFNVPDSLADGSIQHPTVGNQYPMAFNPVPKLNSGNGSRQCPGQAGDDWGVFCVGRPLADTIVKAVFATMSRSDAEVEAEYGDVDVEGFGRDTKLNQNYVQQTARGAAKSPARETCVRHDADAEDGSSGSPIIAQIDGTKKIIGIHVGLDSGDSKYSGTSFDNSCLRCVLKGDVEICKKCGDIQNQKRLACDER
ncbi:MAG: hypothetical protein H6945_08620 [Zoogloeaceae bacterium]|nr:hypothetical protein [Rhodocyclaceae bacterium]MCP5235785.1 hypothetical protein [Zoogloeaceae bacterium]